MFGYALFKDGRNTRLSYPLEKFHSDVAGRSFHNGRFIQRMREKASSLPKYNLSPDFFIKLHTLTFSFKGGKMSDSGGLGDGSKWVWVEMGLG